MAYHDAEGDARAVDRREAPRDARYLELMTALRALRVRVAAKPDAQLANALRAAEAAMLQHVRIPLTRFEGVLKRVARSRLGPKAAAALTYAFPNFIGTIAHAEQRDRDFRHFGMDPHPERSFNDLKRARLGTDVEIKLVERQFRRYSGENNLPPERYASICVDATGDDRQTLCRELFEYTDPVIPGRAFVGDTWDATLVRGLAPIGLRAASGTSGELVVILLPPMEEAAPRLPVFRHFYAPILTACYGPYSRNPEQWDGVTIVTIPTVCEPTVVDGVLDLRDVAARRWFFEFFRHGDGSVFVKSGTNDISCFEEMLPALVYPEYGGSGVTKSVGSWMRAAGVNGLVYPSARSDAAVEVDGQGRVTSFHGWAFVDYRNADQAPDQLVHVDVNPWYGFSAGRQAAPTLRRERDSWAIEGAEERYRRMKASIFPED